VENDVVEASRGRKVRSQRARRSERSASSPRRASAQRAVPRFSFSKRGSITEQVEPILEDIRSKLDFSHNNDSWLRGIDKLRREVYALVRKLRRTFGESDTLEALNGLRMKRNPRSRRQENIYLCVLNLLVTPNELSRSEQHRYASELHYAWLHGVPTELLIGFILQVGAGKGIIQKVSSNAREPWYREQKALKWRPVPRRN